MKKIVTILLAIGLCVALVGLGAIYSRYTNLIEESNAMEGEYQQLQSENEKYINKEQDYKDAIVSLSEEISDKEQEVEVLTTEKEELETENEKTLEELSEAEALIDDIREKLKTTGDPLVKIQQITNENEALMEALSNQSEESESDEETDIVIEAQETVDYSGQFTEWRNELDDVNTSIESRIGELEAAIKPLGELSLERMMIQTEIDFLIELQEEIDEIKGKIN